MNEHVNQWVLFWKVDNIAVWHRNEINQEIYWLLLGFVDRKKNDGHHKTYPFSLTKYFHTKSLL